MANDPDSGMRMRDWLSLLFAVGGFLLTLVLGYTVATRSQDGPDKALSIVLPLVASWVGTVIAYYFSKENLAAATSSVATMSKGMADLQQRLQAIPVTTAMIVRSQIVVFPVAMTNPWQNLEGTSLDQILTFLDANKEGDSIARLEAR